jgi:SnoaL-like protein
VENIKTLMTQMYAAFNRRDIEGTLKFMSENVDWPTASEGGRVTGKKEIREYWTRQWSQFDPHVEPIEVIEQPDGKTDVKVHQLVKTLDGVVLSDQNVWHSYTISGGLIERMDISENTPSFVKGKSS